MSIPNKARCWSRSRRTRTRNSIVQFNPTELTFDKSVQLAEIAIPGLDAPLQQFVRGNAEKLTLELFCDTHRRRAWACRPSRSPSETDKFYQLVKIVPELHAPPVVTFFWNDEFPGNRRRDAWGNHRRNSFTGVAESVRQKFTLFSPEGVPLRATVTADAARMAAARRAAERAEPELARPHAPAPAAAGGETLSGLAGSYYQRAGQWRLVAAGQRHRRPAPAASRAVADDPVDALNVLAMGTTEFITLRQRVERPRGAVPRAALRDLKIDGVSLPQPGAARHHRAHLPRQDRGDRRLRAGRSATGTPSGCRHKYIGSEAEESAGDADAARTRNAVRALRQDGDGEARLPRRAADDADGQLHDHGADVLAERPANAGGARPEPAAPHAPRQVRRPVAQLEDRARDHRQRDRQELRRAGRPEVERQRHDARASRCRSRSTSRPSRSEPRLDVRDAEERIRHRLPVAARAAARLCRRGAARPTAAQDRIPVLRSVDRTPSPYRLVWGSRPDRAEGDADHRQPGQEGDGARLGPRQAEANQESADWSDPKLQAAEPEAARDRRALRPARRARRLRGRCSRAIEAQKMARDILLGHAQDLVKVTGHGHRPAAPARRLAGADRRYRQPPERRVLRHRHHAHVERQRLHDALHGAPRRPGHRRDGWRARGGA